MWEKEADEFPKCFSTYFRGEMGNKIPWWDIVGDDLLAIQQLISEEVSIFPNEDYSEVELEGALDFAEISLS